LAVSPTDAQWIEQQRFTVADVARVFGVAPEMIGGEAGGSLTYANVEGRALDFLRYSVNPWLVRLETGLATLLPRGQTVKFNAGGLLRSTTQERYAAYSVALDKGFLTLDEVRQLEDRPPLPGGALA
jgi:HK97 family phage portal protein